MNDVHLLLTVFALCAASSTLSVWFYHCGRKGQSPVPHLSLPKREEKQEEPKYPEVRP